MVMWHDPEGMHDKFTITHKENTVTNHHTALIAPAGGTLELRHCQKIIIDGKAQFSSYSLVKNQSKVQHKVGVVRWWYIVLWLLFGI